MRRIEPYFRLSQGVPRVDHQGGRVGHHLHDQAGPHMARAPKGYGPHKRVYNRFVRWSRLGVFNRIFAELAGKAVEPGWIMIYAAISRPPHHCQPASLKGGGTAICLSVPHPRVPVPAGLNERRVLADGSRSGSGASLGRAARQRRATVSMPTASLAIVTAIISGQAAAMRHSRT